MTNDVIWAPGIVNSLLRDPEMAAALRNPLPAPRHDPGSNAVGCTAFPADWTDEVLEARAQETVAGDSWRSMWDTYVYYREYHGVWLYVVVRGAPDAKRNVVATFPLRYDEGVTYTPRDCDFIDGLAEAMADALASEAGEWIPTFSYVGRALHQAGEVAEALMWLIESADSFRLKLAEDIYLNLHVMALRGFFTGTRTQSPEEIIAAAWARAYPVTWGLPPRMNSHNLDVDVPWDSVPLPEQVAECAKLWMIRMLPTSRLTEQQRCETLDSAFSADATSVKASLCGKEPTNLHCLVKPQHDDGEAEPFDHWNVELSNDPRNKIAGLAMLLATAELAGTEADYVELPDEFGPTKDAIAVLREVCDYDALQRMVPIVRAP